MEFLIQDNLDNGSRAVLAQTATGEWALRVYAEQGFEDYGPDDRVPDWSIPWTGEGPLESMRRKPPMAYFIIGDWMEESERTAEERRAARLFMDERKSV